MEKCLVPCGSLTGMFHCILEPGSEYVTLSINKTPHAALLHCSALHGSCIARVILQNMIILHFTVHVAQFVNLLMNHNWISFQVTIYELF